MPDDQVVQKNAQVWQDLYAGGGNDLHYPNEFLVRLAARLLPMRTPRKVLDYGCGTGANLIHLASMGHDVHGVEVAPSALERAQERLLALRLPATLHAVPVGSGLPFDDGFFDIVIAWQVLYYNSRDSWAAAVRELERVARPGATVIVATAAPGDISQTQATPLGQCVYLSRVTGQEGCTLVIPEQDDLAALFPARDLEIGEFGYSMGGIRSRHWFVTYTLPSA